MILAIITAWLAYKRANEHGRNGILWAAIGAAVLVGIQLMISFGAGIALGIGQTMHGWPDSIYDDYSLPITALSLVLSVLVSWLLLRYLDRPPNDGNYSAPPPPPKFDDRL